MRVLVYFHQDKKNKDFEGVRLRRTLKGSLEMNGVELVQNYYDKYDVLHLISPDDENLIADALERNVPVVFSAFYAEGDAGVKIGSEPNSKTARVLNKVDLVLTPNEKYKSLLEENGVTTRIEVVPYGTSVSRFEYLTPIEKDMADRYFGLDDKKRVVVSIGDFEDSAALEKLRIITANNEGVIFIFLWNSKKSDKVLRTNLKKLAKKFPPNVIFKPIISEDIYRSLLKKADVLLLSNSYPLGIVTISDAYASKTQIIATKSALECLEKEEYDLAYTSNNQDVLRQYVNMYLKEEIPSKAKAAYEFIKRYGLDEMGKKIKSMYQVLIDERKGD